MPLNFKQPEKVDKRLKCLLFGAAGVGKTTAAIQFPKPAVIDTERGAEQDQYVDAIKERGGAILQTTSFDYVYDQVRALVVEDHPYQTLVIDPLTVLYDDLADHYSKKVGTQFSAHFSEANRDWKRLATLLSSLDMNVVLTCFQKNEWSQGEMTGRMIADGPKKVDHAVDLVVEVRRVGVDRFGFVHKSRILDLPSDKEFPFSYDAIAEAYGRSALEKNAVPASQSLLALMALIDERDDGPDLLGRICKKKKVGTLNELTSEEVEGAIEWLTNA